MDSKSYTYRDGIWKGPELNLQKDYFKWSEKILPILKKSPDFVGQIDAVTGNKETFGSMAEKSVRCAIWLKNQGIKPGDIVGSCSKNNLEACVPFLASLYVGAFFSFWWDEGLDQDIIEYFVDQARPKVLFVDEELAKTITDAMPNINDSIKLVVFGKMDGIESFGDILNQQNPTEVEKFETIKIESPDIPMGIFYTSGTTGKPKGVVHTSGSLGIVFALDDTRIFHKQNNIGIWFSSLCWISSFHQTMRAIMTESTAILHNYSDEVTASKLFQKYKITWFLMPTCIANRFYKSKSILNVDFSSVIQGTFSGSVLSEVVEDFMKKLFVNARLSQAYACTEFMIMTVGPRTADKPAAAGRVSEGAELKVVDPKTKEILGIDEEGEFWVRGKTLMAGYWNNPEATRSVVDSEGWYHTGDLGFYDKDGYVWIIDRLTSLIRYKHHLVSPIMIQNVIRLHPGVFDVGVIGKSHNQDTEHAVAFIVKCPGSEITEREIMELVEKELPEKMWLRGGVYFVDEIPYNTSQKTAKRELCELMEKIFK